MIQVSHLSYCIGQKQLLADVSFEAQAGAFTAIVGANGAGKSTLLKILCRDYPLQQGNVYFHGKPLHSFSNMEMAKIRAVLSQQQQVSLPFVCEELVMMGRYPHFNGHPTKTDHEIVAFAMRQADVAHLQGRVYQTLSGGEQQRVQLARVLAQITDRREIIVPQMPIGTPKYLFLDEPITGLDLLHQYHTLDLVRQLAQKGYCVVAVLHDLNLAAQYADHLIMLKKGRVIAAGSPQQVMTCENIHRVFGVEVNLMQHPELGCPFIVNVRSRQAVCHS
ncbi:MAG: heme ABC transporter ATP-binding protein [Cytophagales bacterium]|nr:heme ABC transporter ATP-binding protein [Bernardetiaceae bacterium]MDW8204842.1 heme ABC transporter ATP-binding protein [Cytophagales bacterium]